MNILIITPDYPDKYKVKYQFVKELVTALAHCGHLCRVIAPYSVSKNRHFYPSKTEEAEDVIVYRPNYLSFSTLSVGGKSLSYCSSKRALNRALRKLDFCPDVVYAHFWSSASLVSDYVREKHLPLFVATGESDIAQLSALCQFPKDLVDLVSGVVCVSTKNKEESVALGLTVEAKCEVIPNAVDMSLFYPMDRIRCRRELGLPIDAFIVSFVGAFCERKGSSRLSSALEKLSGVPVYSIFVGEGELPPSCGNVLFAGQLPHSDVPKYLNASDVFVLPTLKEGCCNAVVEALACGLPVVSSNLPFNWDVLNDKNSIMVDPMDVDGIASSISLLFDERKRKEYSENALVSVRHLSIEMRAEQIVRFIQSRIGGKGVCPI